MSSLDSTLKQRLKYALQSTTEKDQCLYSGFARIYGHVADAPSDILNLILLFGLVMDGWMNGRHEKGQHIVINEAESLARCMCDGYQSVFGKRWVMLGSKPKKSGEHGRSEGFELVKVHSSTFHSYTA